MFDLKALIICSLLFPLALAMGIALGSGAHVLVRLAGMAP